MRRKLGECRLAPMQSIHPTGEVDDVLRKADLSPSCAFGNLRFPR